MLGDTWQGLVSWTCPFLGSMWTLQLHCSCPWSQLPGLSIVPVSMLEGCFTEGKEGCSVPTLSSRVCRHEMWISSPLGVTPQVQSTLVPGAWWASSKPLPVSKARQGGHQQRAIWTSAFSAPNTKSAGLTDLTKLGVALPQAINLPSNKKLCQTPWGEQQSIALLAKTKKGWIPVVYYHTILFPDLDFLLHLSMCCPNLSAQMGAAWSVNMWAVRYRQVFPLVGSGVGGW